MVTAWVALGQALKAAQRSEEAERAYGQAIRLDHTNALARMGLGELMLALGRPEDAIRELDLALRCNPVLIAASMGMGHALTMMGAMKRRFSVTSRCGIPSKLPEASLPPVLYWRAWEN